MSQERRALVDLLHHASPSQNSRISAEHAHGTCAEDGNRVSWFKASKVQTRPASAEDIPYEKHCGWVVVPCRQDDAILVRTRHSSVFG